MLLVGITGNFSSLYSFFHPSLFDTFDKCSITCLSIEEGSQCESIWRKRRRKTFKKIH